MSEAVVAQSQSGLQSGLHSGSHSGSVQPVLERAALVEQTLEQGFPLLFFPRALEADFQLDCQPRRLSLITEAGLAAVLLFGGMLLADWLLTPDTLWLALFLRMAVFAPVIMVGLFLIRSWHRPAVSEWLIAFAGMLAVVLTSVILLSAEGKWGYARLVEFNIIVVYTCTLARFWPALALGAFSLVVHTALAVTLVDFTGVLGINVSLLVFVVLCFTLYGNYTLERDERLAFLMAQREAALQDALQASHEQLARLATTDSLTEVANRRSADTFLAQTWAHARARRLPMAVIMVDIDYFKRYNDHHGHQAGDRCLQAVAAALSGCSRRAGDLVARIGGEEFVLIMPDVDQHTALSVAQRVRDAVQELAVPHAGSMCSDVVTVSVGVAVRVPSGADSRTSLMRDADEALYEAKASGRNRVCAARLDAATQEPNAGSGPAGEEA